MYTCTGSDEVRGLTAWHPDNDITDDIDDDDTETVAMTTYELPVITPLIKRSRWTNYMPVCSTFNGFSWLRCRSNKQMINSGFSDKFTPAEHLQKETLFVDDSSLPASL